MENKDYIYHVVDENCWNQLFAKEHYQHESLGLEGFIHFSYRDQVLWVANKFYLKNDTLVAFRVEKKLVKNEIKEEFSDGKLFPHLYRSLEVKDIDGYHRLKKNEAGSFYLDEYISM